MIIPKVLILRAAGTNCDSETQYAFEKAGAKADVVHVNILLANKKFLRNYQVLALPGGFTYGDDVGAGKILANQIRYNLKEEIQTFIEQKKLILGICNGFQVLSKAGLLPSFRAAFSSNQRYRQEVTLTYNDSHKLEDRWVYLKICSDKSFFIKQDDAQRLYMPVAHGEGKFVTSNAKVLDAIIENHQMVLQYVNEHGEEAGYPFNPNGSVRSVAGICDPTGQILGMMPHPERHVEPVQHPQWTRKGLQKQCDGLLIFRNAVRYVESNF